MKKAAIGLLASVLLAIGGCGKQESASSSAGPSSQPRDAKLTIAVIPKGTTHAFWRSVEAGANAAGTELGVKVIFKGPLREDDAAGQIGLVEQFTADNVSGIVLAPLNDSALLRPVQAATEKKIPVVIIDSGLKGEAGKDYVSFVSTNNKLGGAMAGDEMTRLLGGKGKLVLLRYASFSASTNEREAGFLESIHKSPDFSMLVDNRYGGATEGESQQAAENLLDQLKQADGVFCPNESSTLGMLKVLQQNSLTSKAKFIGFDATPREVEALKKGDIAALVSQNPFKMGYEGVKTCVESIQGKTVEKIIDSSAKLITRENLDNPDVQKLLSAG
ncbi:MAG TPA: substrate-binding domain-containing protein [Tepidisphaeraceae bacterium]|nr:substrate-binding domain-containing protein [Tepidisphaeraceae bacterium]